MKKMKNGKMKKMEKWKMKKWKNEIDQVSGKPEK